MRSWKKTLEWRNKEQCSTRLLVRQIHWWQLNSPRVLVFRRWRSLVQNTPWLGGLMPSSWGAPEGAGVLLEYIEQNSRRKEERQEYEPDLPFCTRKTVTGWSLKHITLGPKCQPAFGWDVYLSSQQAHSVLSAPLPTAEMWRLQPCNISRHDVIVARKRKFWTHDK
jgi:hypothetical protein